MRKKGGKKGFTLIELSLAIGFIAILSLTITLIINDTAATYRRGITLNQVNTTGMDLVDDFRAAIQNSPARQPKYDCETMYENLAGAGEEYRPSTQCANDNASSMIILRRQGYVDTDEDSGTDEVEIPVYGAICLGSFTYIWNSGYFFGENSGETAKANMSEASSRAPRTAVGGTPINKATFTYFDRDKGEQTLENFRLLKVKDSRRGVCKNMIRQSAIPSGGITMSGQIKEYHPSTYYERDLSGEFVANVKRDGDEYYINYFPQGLSEKDVEVVLDDSSTNPLALYDLTITTPVTNSAGEAAFYSASFILGTLTGGINVKAKGNFCKTPEDFPDEDFDYCAINKFNFAAQATGG